MSKKSNKTSHVLNLLTNRTGLPIEKLEQCTLPDAGELEKDILILSEGSVEINAETIEIKTKQTNSCHEVPEPDKKQISKQVDISLSDKIRMQLEFLELQESVFKV